MSGIKAFKDFVGYDSTWGWVRAGSEIWVWWGTEQNLGLGGYWADGSKIWVSLGIGETGSKLWVWPQLGMANHTDARVDTDLGLFISHWQDFFVLFAEGDCSGDVDFLFSCRERAAPFQTAGIIMYLYNYYIWVYRFSLLYLGISCLFVYLISSVYISTQQVDGWTQWVEWFFPTLMIL